MPDFSLPDKKPVANSNSSTADLVAELMKRGASMEQVALLKNSGADTPEEALSALRAGNTRFYSDKPERVFADVNHRRAQIMTQTPFAVILGCSDSRVPVEIIFDQGPGDIFSIRVAGTVAEASTLGSIQYAIQHLKVHLVVVLGHEGCGAVAAAMQDAYTRAQEPQHVRFLLEKIEPAVRDLPPIRDHKAKMREAVVANVRLQKLEVERDPIVAAATQSGQVRVVGAFYEIGSGAVDFLED
ncbi:carbonic anhydrase [Abditibacterium utsteinense]|uniref:Carbonic anhydrase n=1 Tax=Abditibacterium utsteinense TaxID=1960156 RepID=A0A2S8SQQ5_9BACT|nr:carbonic anhydrase [Abditibacterium utsteinense]PQV63115.1 carbonic anhydrase [Abditibacterium utsteinense]